MRVHLFEAHGLGVAPTDANDLGVPLERLHLVLRVGVDVGLLQLDFGEADVKLQHVGVQLLEGLQEVVATEKAHLFGWVRGFGVAVQFLHRLFPHGEVGFDFSQTFAEGLLVFGDFLGGRTTEHAVVGDDGAAITRRRTAGHAILFQVVDLAQQVNLPAFQQRTCKLVADLLVEQVAADVLRILIHRFRSHARNKVDVELQRGGGVWRQRAQQRDDVGQSVAGTPRDVRTLVAVLGRDGLCVAARYMQQGQLTLARRTCRGVAGQLRVDVVGVVDAQFATATTTEESRHFGISLAAQPLGLFVEVLQVVNLMDGVVGVALHHAVRRNGGGAAVPVGRLQRHTLIFSQRTNGRTAFCCFLCCHSLCRFCIFYFCEQIYHLLYI